MSPAKTITQRALIAASPRQVYQALLIPRLHAAFTGAPAAGSTRVGGRFTAYGDYITAVHRELVPGKRIVQDWRTSEWPEGAAPSRVEFTFRPSPQGTTVRMVHSNVPPTQADSYRQGWIDYYWSPLKEYFARRRPGAVATKTGRRSTGRSGAGSPKRSGR